MPDRISSVTRAFTVIELLIVVLIIAVLMALLLVGTSGARLRARALQTVQRIEFFQNALQGYGKETGNVCAAYQHAIPGFGGTTLFDHVGVPAVFQPAGNAAWHLCYPNSGAGSAPVLAFPWGKRRGYELWTYRGGTFAIEPWYTDPSFGFTALPPANATPAQVTAFRAQWNSIEPHQLADLHPDLSAELATLVGIANSTADYLADRNPNRAWNDAWGNPLIAARMLFQPPEYNLTRDSLYRRDHYLGEALKGYQYNRSAYFAIAAIGPVRDPNVVTVDLLDGTPMTPAQLDQVWKQACDVCMPTPEQTWTQDSFDRPPWVGVKQGDLLSTSSRRLDCFLSAPIEVK